MKYKTLTNALCRRCKAAIDMQWLIETDSIVRTCRDCFLAWDQSVIDWDKEESEHIDRLVKENEQLTMENEWLQQVVWDLCNRNEALIRSKNETS